MELSMIRAGFVFIVFAVLLGCGQSVPPSETPKAQTVPALTQGVTIDDAHVPTPPPGAKVAAGLLTIANGGAGDRLIGAESPRAGRVEIHEMKTENDVMKMRKVDGLDVPAGTLTQLSGDAHLMFFDMPTAFAEGETVPVTLVFEKAGRVDASYMVRNRDVSGGHTHDGHDHEH
jgi:copper(I)-binding protein